MRKVLLSISLLLLAASLQAQDRIAVGLEAGVSAPYGVRLSGAVRFSELLSLRAGADYLPSMQVQQREIGPLSIPAMKQAMGVEPKVLVTGKLKSLHGHLLLDLHPFRSGFRITTGLYVGSLGMTALGQLIHPETKEALTPSTEVYGMLLQEGHFPFDMKVGMEGLESLRTLPDRQGQVHLSAEVGQLLKPYLGIGYGYAVPRSRVSFMADLGVVYSGPIKFASPNVVRQEGGKWVPDDLDAMLHRAEPVKRYEPYARVIPVLSLGCSVRLF